MPKKKGQKKNIPKDVTINDSANAPKPVGRVKKSTGPEKAPDISWDQIDDDDFDIIEEINPDGTKNFVYRKKKNAKSELNIDERPGLVYPEILWYQISKYIKPEDIGSFAGINKTTYVITRQKSFWKSIYIRYCENNPKLPVVLRIENSFKIYGLRQRVIRALYHTYEVFILKASKGLFERKPHELVKLRCVNVWFCKGPVCWSIYFKFKKLWSNQNNKYDFIEELGRIDANPEEDSKVLLIVCENYNEVPPIMGMVLSSASLVLAQNLFHRTMRLGFNSSLYNVSRDILPECTVTIETIIKMAVLDWWNPNYPHFETELPCNTGDDSMPVLKKDFFDTFSGA